MTPRLPFLVAGAAALAGLAAARAASAQSFGKKPLTGDKRDWSERLARDARAVVEAAGFPWSVAWGQAAVETGYGSAGASNPWGLRGAGDAGSSLITTHEELTPGVKVKQTAQKFAKFSSNAAAAQGYARFLSGPTYRRGWPLRGAPGAWLLWLWAAGYATASSYPPTVVDVSRKLADTFGDARFAVPWSPAHAEVWRVLSKLAPGSARRNEAARIIPGVLVTPPELT